MCFNAHSLTLHVSKYDQRGVCGLWGPTYGMLIPGAYVHDFIGNRMIYRKSEDYFYRKSDGFYRKSGNRMVL